MKKVLDIVEYVLEYHGVFLELSGFRLEHPCMFAYEIVTRQSDPRKSVQHPLASAPAPDNVRQTTTSWLSGRQPGHP